MAFLGVLLIAVLAGSVFDVSARSTSSLHSSFERYVELLEKINSSPELRREWQQHMALERDYVAPRTRESQQYLARLNCPNILNRSPTKPTSVHKLRPGDIDVIAAMGDSLTAGNGANAWTVIGCLTEYRGKSWSVGGDGSYESGHTTLPNILRQFNPNLKGFSVGSGNAQSAGAKLNVAVAGNIAQDMPRQAWDLVEKLKKDSSIDFQNDWKMVTLFIGGNNLCAFCEDEIAHSAATMIANVEEAVTILKAEVPRMFVNLVEIFDISPVVELGNTGWLCGVVHNSVCSCGHGDNADPAGLTYYSLQYQAAFQNLNLTKFNSDDFVVVNQPFFRNTTPPVDSEKIPDMSYFAPDCFHFSNKGQYLAGKALWNSLIAPLSAKPTTWSRDLPAGCPPEYLPTPGN